MWLTNGGSSNLAAVLVKTDEGAETPYQNMTTLPGREAPRLRRGRRGLSIPGKIEKMGYKGVDTTEMVFDGHRMPADQVLGRRARARASAR